jgi:hypothetical protein
MLYQEVSQQDLKDTYAFSFISISLMFSLGKPVAGVTVLQLLLLLTRICCLCSCLP